MSRLAGPARLGGRARRAPREADAFDRDRVKRRRRRGASRRGHPPADLAPARPRPAADGRAARRERPAPPRGHAQSRRRRGRGGSSPARRAVERLCVRSGRKPDQGRGRPALSRRALSVAALGRGDRRAGGDGAGLAALEQSFCATGTCTGPALRTPSDGALRELVRRRRFPIVGSAGGIFSFVHVDDAAAATVLALERGAGVLNVVDDEPAPVRTWLPVYAAGDRRSAAAPGAHVSPPERSAGTRRLPRDRAAWRVERPRQARARVAARATRAGARASAAAPAEARAWRRVRSLRYISVRAPCERRGVKANGGSAVRAGGNAPDRGRRRRSRARRRAAHPRRGRLEGVRAARRPDRGLAGRRSAAAGAAREDGVRRRGARRLVRGLAGRGVRRHGPVRLGQVDARPDADPPDRADRGRDLDRGPGRDRRRRGRSSASSAVTTSRWSSSTSGCSRTAA